MTKTLAATSAVAVLVLAPSTVAATWDAHLLARDDNNNAHAARYDKLLNRLQPRCRQGRSAIARYTLGAKRVMNADGYHYTNLTLLLTLSGTIPNGRARVDCVGRYASMVVLLEQHP
ncbi:MAG TPA: hypothetical protein VFU10_09620 [Gaiellaceae bacterium]|nr:hypothetical protein [Gaiellaceae bacterium]